MTERIWFCKIGGETDFFEKGADSPMRRAIAKAFREVTGRDPQFTFSGWGQELTESERAVAEDREPKVCHPHLYTCKNCGIEPTTTASALETISAQHDETGRMWEGPRDQLPPGYSAVKRNDGITVTDLRGVDPKPPY